MGSCAFPSKTTNRMPLPVVSLPIAYPQSLNLDIPAARWLLNSDSSAETIACMERVELQGRGKDDEQTGDCNGASISLRIIRLAAGWNLSCQRSRRQTRKSSQPLAARLHLTARCPKDKQTESLEILAAACPAPRLAHRTMSDRR